MLPRRLRLCRGQWDSSFLSSSSCFWSCWGSMTSYSESMQSSGTSPLSDTCATSLRQLVRNFVSTSSQTTIKNVLSVATIAGGCIQQPSSRTPILVSAQITILINRVTTRSSSSRCFRWTAQPMLPRIPTRCGRYRAPKFSELRMVGDIRFVLHQSSTSPE